MEKWRSVFGYMTRGADMRSVLLKSGILAVAAVFFTIPYFLHLTRTMGSRLDLWGLMGTQLLMLFIVCLLSAVVGFSYSKRLDLPGFGDFKLFLGALPYLILASLALIMFSYVCFDRYFYSISPASYPKHFSWLLSIPFKRALTDEIILRLGLITIGVGLFRDKLTAIVLVSILLPLFSVKYFDFLGLDRGFNYLFIIQLISSFLTNLISGWLFVFRGLLYTMALNFFFGFKYLMISMIGIT
jgi:hypothetical protein